MDATVLADWRDFFAAQLGAGATLLGLLFVGLSINLDKILQTRALPNRALLTLGLLLGTLLTSSYVMIPQQEEASLGYEIFCTAVGLSLIALIIEVRSRKDIYGSVAMYYVRATFLAAALIPYLIGGWLLIAGGADGLYWVAAAIIISFIRAVTDAWVLLVEINR
jgi:modulator of FtsH protease